MAAFQSIAGPWSQWSSHAARNTGGAGRPGNGFGARAGARNRGAPGGTGRGGGRAVVAGWAWDGRRLLGLHHLAAGGKGQTQDGDQRQHGETSRTSCRCDARYHREAPLSCFYAISSAPHLQSQTLRKSNGRILRVLKIRKQSFGTPSPPIIRYNAGAKFLAHYQESDAELCADTLHCNRETLYPIP